MKKDLQRVRGFDILKNADRHRKADGLKRKSRDGKEKISKRLQAKAASDSLEDGEWEGSKRDEAKASIAAR
jgi:lipopolysaccharide export LptBFGC system permease protein LptF